MGKSGKQRGTRRREGSGTEKEGETGYCNHSLALMLKVPKNDYSKVFPATQEHVDCTIEYIMQP